MRVSTLVGSVASLLSADMSSGSLSGLRSLTAARPAWPRSVAQPVRSTGPSCFRLWLLGVAWAGGQLGCGGIDGESTDSVARSPAGIDLQWKGAGSGTGPTEFVMAPSIAWVSDSSFAVLDLSDQQVVVYHVTGRELLRLGQTGSGPGEFRGASVVLGMEPGGVVVADAALSRLTVFDAAGRFVRTTPLAGFPQHLLSVVGSTVTAVWVVPGPAGSGPVVGRIDLLTGESRELFEVFATDSALGVVNAATGSISPFVAAAALDSGMYVFGEPRTYRVVVVDTSGRLALRFGREDLAEEVPNDTEVARREERMREALRSVGRTPPPEVQRMMEEAVRAPKPFFTVTSFAADERGRLWIATTRGSPDSTALDVFSRGGRLLATVSIPHHVRALAVRGSYGAVIVERHDHTFEGQYAVDVYRIVDPDTE